MSVSTKLESFLSERHCPYEVLKHPKTFSAQGAAAALHVPGKEVAKTVVLRAAGTYALAVLPAPLRVDLAALRDPRAGTSYELATEDEIRRLFPDCETGAMPPFGNLYGLPVYVDQTLAEDEEIVFEAGTHREAIKMAYGDYVALVHPSIQRFARAA